MYWLYLQSNTKTIQINLKLTQNELKRIDSNSKPIQIGQKLIRKINTATASSGVDFQQYKTNLNQSEIDSKWIETYWF